MKCENVQIKLSAYMDGELDAMLHREIAEHLRRCPECREELKELGSIDTLLRGLPPLSLPADFAKIVASTVQGTVSIEQRRPLLSRGWKVLLEYSEKFFDLLEPETPGGARSLDEFNDIPASFIGHAYFKVLGSQS